MQLLLHVSGEEDDLDCILGGGSGVRQIEANTESPQPYSCLQDLLGVIPRASMNDAFRKARLKVSEGRRRELWEGGPCQGLIDLFLTCGGTLNNMVTPPHNHQTGSMRIKPPLEVDSFGTGSNSHSPNRFRCRRDESGFAPRLHL